MNRPRLLDLFSGAGGCSVGFHRAGFDVVAVDHLDHPDYPKGDGYTFIKADALDVLTDLPFLRTFDVRAGSPPCPGYSTSTPDPDQHPRLIPDVRAGFLAAGGPYIIENVVGAKRHMISPVMLCGRSFGLRAQRHRLFESNAGLLVAPHCGCAKSAGPAVGVYGDHPDRPGGWKRPNGTSRGVKAASIEDAQDALGIDWMTEWDDLTDAIPPVFCTYLGTQLLDQLTAVA